MFVIIVSGPVKSRSSRSFFTEIFFFFFAFETKCNFFFIPSRLHRPSRLAFILPHSPPWGLRRKWSLTPLSLMELQALFVFRAVCLWVMQRWPHSPALHNSTTSDIPLLAPVQHTPWENTSAGEMMKDNQSAIWPFTPQLKPHLPLKCLSLHQMKQFASLHSLLYYVQNGVEFVFTFI